MKKHLLYILLIPIVIVFLSSCWFTPPVTLSLDDFAFLEKGMHYEQVVGQVGKPTDQIIGSDAFITYIYILEDGTSVYLSFLRQVDYLDRAYANQGNGEGDYVFISLVPASLELPAGVQRQLTLEDFEGLSAGMEFFPDIYNQVGPPNNSGIFEGGDVSLIYYLSSGGRIAMQTHGGYGCISLISYSPDSFGPNWTDLSEDTQGLCGSE